MCKISIFHPLVYFQYPMLWVLVLQRTFNFAEILPYFLHKEQKQLSFYHPRVPSWGFTVLILLNLMLHNNCLLSHCLFSDSRTTSRVSLILLQTESRRETTPTSRREDAQSYENLKAPSNVSFSDHQNPHTHTHIHCNDTVRLRSKKMSI